jgi:hypothetical protein
VFPNKAENWPGKSSRKTSQSLCSQESGGEGGIRTLGTGVSPYNGLANRRIRPLCHLSGVCGATVYHAIREWRSRFNPERLHFLMALCTHLHVTWVSARFPMSGEQFGEQLRLLHGGERVRKALHPGNCFSRRWLDVVLPGRAVIATAKEHCRGITCLDLASARQSLATSSSEVRIRKIGHDNVLSS